MQGILDILLSSRSRHAASALSSSAIVSRLRFVLAAVAAGAVAGCAPAAVPVSAGVAADCAGYRPGQAPALRMGGENRARLVSAQALLAPGFTSSGAVTGLAILAEYQAEMDRPQPDRMTAALYLATLSTRPVTVGLIDEVNRTLCVATSAAAASDMAASAEQARREMGE